MPKRPADWWAEKAGSVTYWYERWNGEPNAAQS